MNQSLTSMAWRFIKKVQTSSSYRVYRAENKESGTNQEPCGANNGHPTNLNNKTQQFFVANVQNFVTN